MGMITLRQAALLCGGTVEPQYADVVFCGAANDTRTIKPGQLFIALSGKRDGHDFIPAAMAAGAAAALCSRKTGDYPAVYVEDPRTALGILAREERKRIGFRAAAVTGSVGKSTTKEMTARVLETTFRTARTPANHNNDIGMPMAILGMPDDTEAAVLEMGMNHFGELSYLSKIGLPDMGVIVNIGTAHMEFLGSREGIRKAKLEIADGMAPEAPLLLNGDDSMLRYLPEDPGHPVVYFGTDEGCAVYADGILQDAGLSFTVHAGSLAFPVTMQVEGIHYVADALAAAAVGLQFGVSPENIAAGLAAFRNLEGRQELSVIGGVTFLKDYYNASPESMAASLRVLGTKKGRRIALLGDMLELGTCTTAEHYRVGRIAAENADLVLAFGPNAERVVSGCQTGGMSDRKALGFTEKQELIREVLRTLRNGDTVLVKGSRGMHMEEVIDAFVNGLKSGNGGNAQ